MHSANQTARTFIGMRTEAKRRVRSVLREVEVNERRESFTKSSCREMRRGHLADYVVRATSVALMVG